MHNKIYGIFGASGFGREVLPLVRPLLEQGDEIYFIDTELQPEPIGRSFHANIYSYVAHDCIIGDYVTFAPSVKCTGNVVIEDCVYIGTGAMRK